MNQSELGKIIPFEKLKKIYEFQDIAKARFKVNQ
jgi:hypothetical protein